jgi:hypothetical protein
LLRGAVAAVIVTCLAGTPAPLPDVALGSAILLHVERTVALLSGSVVVLILITKAWSGQLPTEMSTQGFRYAEAGVVAMNTADQIEEIQSEIAGLRSYLERIEDGP